MSYSPAQLAVYRSGAKAAAIATGFEAKVWWKCRATGWHHAQQGISIKPDGSEVVVGDKANQLHFYSIVGDAVSKIKVGPCLVCWWCPLTPQGCSHPGRSQRRARRGVLARWNDDRCR